MVSEERVERFSRLFPQLGMVYTKLESSLEDTTLTKLDLAALKVLGKQEHLIMSELAEKMSVALSSTTEIVDRLVARDYVCRSRIEEDRRIVQVRLTDKGENLLADHRRQGRVMVEGMLSCLAEKEQEELIRILEKVEHTLSKI